MTQPRFAPFSSVRQLLRCTFLSAGTLFTLGGVWLLLPASGTPGTGFMAQLIYVVETLAARYGAGFWLWALALAGLFLLYRAFLCGGGPARFAAFSVPRLLVGLAFALFYLVGSALEELESFSVVFLGKFQLLLTLGAGFFAFALFYGLAGFLPEVFHRLSALHGPLSDRLTRRVFGRHPLAGPFCLLLLCWLPVAVLAFPGGFSRDAGVQMDLYLFGTNNHYPWLTTKLVGWAVTTAGALGHANAALFLLSTAQALFFAFCLAYVLFTARRLGLSALGQAAGLVFFALCPVWPIYALCLVKDTWFTGALAVFCCLLALRALGQVPDSAAHYAKLFLLALLFCLTRNNGVYLAVAAFVLPALTERRRILPAALALSVFLCCRFVTGPLMVSQQVSPSGKQEMLTVPFQQTARVARDYPDDVTDPERAAIDGVLDYENLARQYDPALSDPVKSHYEYQFYWSWNPADSIYIAFESEEKAAMQAYFAAWAAQGLRHPGTYLDATLAGTYGYFYPADQRVYGPVELDLYLHPGDNPAAPVLSQPAALDSLRTLYCKTATMLGKLPFVGLLFHPCLGGWAALLLTVWVLGHRRWRLLPFVLTQLLVVAFCLLSPVNACLRYMLPLLTLFPVLAALPIAKTQEAHP